MRPPSIPHAPFAALLLYCRAGFEKECAQEIAAACAAREVSGFVRARPDAGFVEYVLHEPDGNRNAIAGIRFDDLVFARQFLFALPWLRDLPVTDRLSALLPAIASLGTRFSAVLLETADTNEAKELSAFLRRFRSIVDATLKREGLLAGNDGSLPRLHLFFAGSSNVCIAISDPANSSHWEMGVPRLRMPAQAPSRSTLKLAEAFQHWLSADDEAELLHEGITAVDLGAAPGGWTWQLVRRGVHVIAVDNGPLDSRLLETGLVEHVRADGFRFRPRWPVQWMVCDMVEQPIRVAELVAEWLANGWCTHTIFNLKLPCDPRPNTQRGDRLPAGLQAPLP